MDAGGVVRVTRLCCIRPYHQRFSLSGAAAARVLARAFGFMRDQPVGALLRAFTGFFCVCQERSY